MIGMLQSGTADMVLADIPITSETAQYIGRLLILSEINYIMRIGEKCLVK